MSPDDIASLTTSLKPATKPLPMRLAIADYDRTRPLTRGIVQPEGIHLTTASPHIAEFCNVPVYEQYDIAEMSFSLFVAARARGDKVIALPIFPLRMAVLAYVFCRDDAPYTHPSQLVGKRIASIGYRYTVNLWLRGMLNEHYGMPHDKVTWVLGQHENAGFTIPKGIDYVVKDGRTPGDLLLSGEADAVIGPEAPVEYLKGDKRIRRLFPDARGEGVDYFRKTGIFPTTHIVVMSEPSFRARPWVAEPLVKAFTEAQRQTDEFIYGNAKHSILPDAVFYLEEERRLWGENPWPHGIKANRNTIETFVRYAHEQGYIDRRLAIEEMFPESTLHL